MSAITLSSVSNITDIMNTGLNSSGCNGASPSLAALASSSPAIDVEYIFNGVVIPAIGVFGVIGNLLNLIILTWRYNKKEVDILEKGSLLGLIALAVSDMVFCMLIIPHAFFYKHKTLFPSHSFRMYYQMYGLYLKNTFIKTSTSLTLVVGLARYIAICHPLKARHFIGLNGIRASCIITYIFWFLLMSPMLLTYKVHEFPKPNGTIYIIDLGKFTSNVNLNMTFTILWSVLGYFVPVVVLSACNINLIKALRNSMRLRKATVRRGKNSKSSNADVSFRVTLTLVALIVMFMLLVSPSEILYFITEVVDTKKYRAYELAVMFTNVLQAFNFAFHFVLYCSVNATFRRAVIRSSSVVFNCSSSRSGGNNRMYQAAPLQDNGVSRTTRSLTLTSSIKSQVIAGLTDQVSYV